MPRLAIRVVGMYLITVLDLRFLMQTSLCLPPSYPPPPCSCAGSVLRAALEARSYHKELVLVANSLHKLGGLSQLVANFEALGYGHILLLSEAWDLGPRTALRP